MQPTITDEVTLIHCSRRRVARTVRKFRAACGSTVSFSLVGKTVVDVTSDHLRCKVGCPHCFQCSEKSFKIISETA